jgi:hypothetical protein
LIGGLPSPKIVLLWRPFGKLSYRHEAAVLGLRRQTPPLREAELPDVRHWELRLPAQHIPSHDIDADPSVILADDIGARPRCQFLRLKRLSIGRGVAQSARKLSNSVSGSPSCRARLHIYRPLSSSRRFAPRGSMRDYGPA